MRFPPAHVPALRGAAALTLAAALLLPSAGCKTSASTSVSSTSTQTGRAGYQTPSPAEMESAASSRSELIGLPAPDFTLPDHNGNPVSLSDLRGQWNVVYFYPKDDTPGCACQANEFTLLLINFKEQNAAIYGISADTPASHRMFRDKYDIEIPLLSDTSRSVMNDYGAWNETSIAGRTVGRTIRSTFLIDPQGNIAWHWPEVIPTGHAQRVADKLTELQNQRAQAAR